MIWQEIDTDIQTIIYDNTINNKSIKKLER